MIKNILKILVLAGMFVMLLCGSGKVEAATATKILMFSAINAGYTDEDKIGQNYDFIELVKTGVAQVALSEYKISYFNSVGKLAGEVVFGGQQKMVKNKLILGSKYSPQYKNSADGVYLYNFGSTGLASTAGRLTLTHGDTVVDEVCWGKIECVTESYEKFSSEMGANQSLSLDWQSSEVVASYEKYYPALDFGAIEIETAKTQCVGLVFSEIYSYFENDYAEQFVEVFNSSVNNIDLAQCRIFYKNKGYVMNGVLGPKNYFAYRNSELKLSKNPSSANSLEIVDSNGEIVDEAEYYNGQKKASSYALIGGVGWLQTYALTPGVENIYQQYKSCPEGKITNPDTGNCVNIEGGESVMDECPEGKYRNPETGRCKSYESSGATLEPCKEGYFRNPETNRCKKITNEEEDEKVACKEGYERNPETGRCRKIRINEGADYPVLGENYSNSSTFLAYGALLLILIAGGGYVVFQFRKEITIKLREIYRKMSKNWRILQKLPILVRTTQRKFTEISKRVKQKIEKYGKH